jgi:hypothetical protein
MWRRNAQAATATGSHELTQELLSSAAVLRCLWEALVDQRTGQLLGLERGGGGAGGGGGRGRASQVLVLPFAAGAEEAGKDQRWDVVAEAFGLLGRGNGWDRFVVLVQLQACN